MHRYKQLKFRVLNGFVCLFIYLFCTPFQRGRFIDCGWFVPCVKSV